MNLFDKAVEVILSVSQINLLQLNIILVVTYFAFTFFFMHCLKSAEERHTQWTLDPDYFEKKTVHDDEKDHRSQHFRRYGHGASLMTSVIQFHFMQHLLTFIRSLPFNCFGVTDLRHSTVHQDLTYQLSRTCAVWALQWLRPDPAYPSEDCNISPTAWVS